MSHENHAPGLLATVLPGLSLVKTIEQDKAEIAHRKAEYEAALERVKTHSSKESRDKIRDQKRRDEIIGHLFAAVCETSPGTWIEFEPDLQRWLDDADDADRALFSLPPKKVVEPPKGDTEAGSKAAAPADKQPNPKPEQVQQPAS